ncbi:hypothetical protein SARC_17943, partial [Sphaeroforma arctica JP610]
TFGVLSYRSGTPFRTFVALPYRSGTPFKTFEALPYREGQVHFPNSIAPQPSISDKD